MFPAEDSYASCVPREQWFQEISTGFIEWLLLMILCDLGLYLARGLLSIFRAQPISAAL